MQLTQIQRVNDPIISTSASNLLYLSLNSLTSMPSFSDISSPNSISH